MLRSWEKKEIIKSLFDAVEEMVDAKDRMNHEKRYENAKEHNRILENEYKPARKKAEQCFEALENNHRSEIRWYSKD